MTTPNVSLTDGRGHEISKVPARANRQVAEVNYAE